MKKIILNLIVLIGISFLMSGCLSAPYKYEYISGQIKQDLQKVNKNICVNEVSTKDIITPNNHKIDFHIKETNKNVSIKYFEQYFIDVNKKDKECFLTVNTKINQIDSEMISLDGMNAKFQMEVNIKKDTQNLVNFKENEVYSSDVFITFALLGLSAPYKTANEAFHKGLLDVYETKIEKLLLKALEENQ